MSLYFNVLYVMSVCELLKTAYIIGIFAILREISLVSLYLFKETCTSLEFPRYS